MKRTINLTGSLASRFGSQFVLDVDTPEEAVRALCVQLKGFKRALAQGNWYVKAGEEYLGPKDMSKEVEGDYWFIPEVMVAKGEGVGKAIAGAALLGVTFLSGGAFGVVATKLLTTMGTGMLLQGVGSMISPTPPAVDARPQDQKTSYLFQGMANPTTEGVTVPVLYGTAWCNAINISTTLETREIEGGDA